MKLEGGPREGEGVSLRPDRKSTLHSGRSALGGRRGVGRAAKGWAGGERVGGRRGCGRGLPCARGVASGKLLSSVPEGTNRSWFYSVSRHWRWRPLVCGRRWLRFGLEGGALGRGACLGQAALVNPRGYEQILVL